MMRLMLMPFFSASRLTVPVTLVSSSRSPVVAGVIADRQAEVGNAHMLDLALRALDQAGGAVLQVGQVAL
jgi:hypothetical protein